MCPVFHPHSNHRESSFKASAQDLSTSTRLSSLKPEPFHGPQGPCGVAPPTLLPSSPTTLSFLYCPPTTLVFLLCLTYDSHMPTQDLFTCYFFTSFRFLQILSRTPSATPHKDFPLNPGTLYSFFFLITLITTI